jgi:hypothetical protein
LKQRGVWSCNVQSIEGPGRPQDRDPKRPSRVDQGRKYCEEKMPDDDRPLLSDPSLTAVVLHAAAAGPVDLDDLERRLGHALDTARQPRPAPGEIRPRIQALCADLAIAGLIEPRGGGFALTGEGRRAVEEHPQGLDRADLMAWPAYAAHVRGLAARTGAPSIAPHDGTHPSAYLEGVAARVAGIAASDNPHPTDTADHLAWENGWAEAEAG